MCGGFGGSGGRGCPVGSRGRSVGPDARRTTFGRESAGRGRRSGVVAACRGRESTGGPRPWTAPCSARGRLIRWRCRSWISREFKKWCADRVPERALHQVRVECEIAPRHLTIVERRAPYTEDDAKWTTLPAARLRYTTADRTRQPYRRDRNLRFHAYDLHPPSPHITELLDELDPTCIFWG